MNVELVAVQSDTRMNQETLNNSQSTPKNHSNDPITSDLNGPKNILDYYDGSYLEALADPHGPTTMTILLNQL